MYRDMGLLRDIIPCLYSYIAGFDVSESQVDSLYRDGVNMPIRDENHRNKDQCPYDICGNYSFRKGNFVSLFTASPYSVCSQTCSINNFTCMYSGFQFRVLVA